MRPVILISAALAALLLAGTARADNTPIYKWVDDKGQVHYSTEPHTDNAKQLTIQNSATAPSAGTSAAPGATTAGSADAGLVRSTPGDSDACKQARARLSKYLNADKLYKLDDKGNRVALSPDEVKGTLDETRDSVRQACAAPAGGDGGGA